MSHGTLERNLGAYCELFLAAFSAEDLGPFCQGHPLLPPRRRTIDRDLLRLAPLFLVDVYREP